MKIELHELRNVIREIVVAEISTGDPPYYDEPAPEDNEDFDASSINGTAKFADLGQRDDEDVRDFIDEFLQDNPDVADAVVALKEFLSSNPEIDNNLLAEFVLWALSD